MKCSGQEVDIATRQGKPGRQFGIGHSPAKGQDSTKYPEDDHDRCRRNILRYISGGGKNANTNDIPDNQKKRIFFIQAPK